MKNLLKQIILEQNNLIKESTILRKFPEILEINQEILVISGVRRCGKSVLLQQIRSRQTEKDYFINFDDERLINFKVDDFQLLHETFIELFGVQNKFYFDEIQNINKWERFVRRLYDNGYKVFLTGSNASMLSRELGTHLTGRYCSYELYPFSFSEFLEIENYKFTKNEEYTTEGKIKYKKIFELFLKNGGIPIYLQNKNDLYLKSLLESILYRDVMVRNNLTNEHEMLELVNFLSANVSKLFSYNSLSKTIGLKNATTIKNYIDFLINCYLVFQVSKFDFSLRKQIQNPKKVYFIDNAIIQRLGFNFSDNFGRLLENTIFLELKRRNLEIFYHHNILECDFVIRSGTKITQAIQVCYDLSNSKTKDREISGLLEAIEIYSLNEGLIISFEQEEEITINTKLIKIIPAWKWILNLI